MIVSDNINAKIENAAEQFTKINQEKYEWSLALPGLKKRVIRLLVLLQSAMYPGIFGEKPFVPMNTQKTVRKYLRLSARQLRRILKDVLPGEDTEHITCQFIGSLAGIADYLDSDIKAAYEGDPAALSEKEIMLSYPAFEAISIYRMAHRLHELSVPLIPRIMTEYAHSITGIDIHPGAQIGRCFFIDHGTGVVIYAGATILGGNTVIGDNCVIGGNVWLTHSVEAGKKIFYNNED